MTRTPGRPRRGRAPLPDGQRKDRLLQTRVPGELDETLREAARRQRVTVSQLIRNVLEDTFKLVDGIVTNTANLTAAVRRDALRLAASARGEAAPARGQAGSPRGEATPAPAGSVGRGGASKPTRRKAEGPAGDARGVYTPELSEEIADVDAWQEVVVGREAVCAGCGEDLARGAKALLGLRAGAAAARVWLCSRCAARI